MKKLASSSITSITILLLTGCNALVNDEFPIQKPIPVLNATLFADSSLSVEISLSVNLSDSLPIPVENALVIIENNASLTDTLSHRKTGIYTSPQRVLAGNTYKCRVEVPGFEPISAQTRVPLLSTIDTVFYNEIAGMDENGNALSSFEFSIFNEPQLTLFWEVRLVEEGEHRFYNWETNNWEEQFYIRNNYTAFMIAGNDPVLLNETTPLTLFSNKHMIGNYYIAKLYTKDKLSRMWPDFNHYIELRSVDVSYYKFQKQYQLYQTADLELMGNSPQNYPLYTNVNNGLGIFSSAAISRYLIKSAK